ILILHARRGIIARMKDRLATRRRRQRLFCAVLMIAGQFCACASPGQVAVKAPGGRLQNYPPVIEDKPQRRQDRPRAREELIAEAQLPEARPDLEVVLNAPRALPPEMAGRIALQTKAGEFGEPEAKEALRRFIERASGVLFPNHTNGSPQSSIGLK